FNRWHWWAHGTASPRAQGGHTGPGSKSASHRSCESEAGARTAAASTTRRRRTPSCWRSPSSSPQRCEALTATWKSCAAVSKAWSSLRGPPADVEYVALDLETTGLDPDRDRVIEVGAVVFTLDSVRTTLERLADPGRSIPDVVQRLTGITPEDLTGAPP